MSTKTIEAILAFATAGLGAASRALARAGKNELSDICQDIAFVACGAWLIMRTL